jgi:thiol-disulfide isomerase/thioredoxin
MKSLLRLFLFIFVLGLLVYLSFFRSDEVPPSPVGTWRGVLTCPGGEIPFGLDIKEKDGTFSAGVRNGKEYLPFSSVTVMDRRITLGFDHYDSFIKAELKTGTAMKGKWSRRSMGGKRTVMDFHAEKDVPHRFPPPVKNETTATLANISGEWRVVFRDEAGRSEAKGIFSQTGSRVEGTFLTPVGDYRFLEGCYERGLLRLSVFDGAHAFLFRAKVDAEGKMKGDFWSRDSYFATWTGVKGSKEMPDPYTLTKLTNREKRFGFNFPDPEGNPVTESDERFKDRVLIVYIFGTWCPNCNDEAPYLEELYKKYHKRGLEIVGLANEFSGDEEKDRDMIKRYKKKYGLSWPVLLVGIADKKKTAEALADLDRVLSYPTTVFMDRQKQVQKIYTGFNGPGTGKYHQTLREEFEEIIETLLQ